MSAAYARVLPPSQAAIAEQMGRSEDSVRSLLTRARAELAYRLEALHDHAPPAE